MTLESKVYKPGLLHRAIVCAAKTSSSHQDDMTIVKIVIVAEKCLDRIKIALLTSANALDRIKIVYRSYKDRLWVQCVH